MSSERCVPCALSALTRVEIVARTLDPRAHLEDYLVEPCRRYGVPVGSPVTAGAFLKDLDGYRKNLVQERR